MAARIYLASRFTRRLELCVRRSQLNSLGYNVQARWLDGSSQYDPDLIQAVESNTGDNVHTGSIRFALDDLEDIQQADTIISFTEPTRNIGRTRGGRHVEFGMGYALGHRMIIVGPLENIFHTLPRVEQYPDWDECYNQLECELLAARLVIR